MNLLENWDGVRVEGEGSERDRIAYASEKDGRLEYTIESGPINHNGIAIADSETLFNASGGIL